MVGVGVTMRGPATNRGVAGRVPVRVLTRGAWGSRLVFLFDFGVFRVLGWRTFAFASGANAWACFAKGLFLVFGLASAARLMYRTCLFLVACATRRAFGLTAGRGGLGVFGVVVLGVLVFGVVVFGAAVLGVAAGRGARRVLRRA